MSVEITFEDSRWEAAGLQALAEQAVAATLAQVQLAPEAWEVSILACDDARIAGLNADFRGKPSATNVLSWPSDERGAEIAGDVPGPPMGDPELGDLAIAFETCEREANDQGKPFKHHALHLLVHGVLHLLGYDHERDADGDLMERQEIAILATLGVDNPYL